MRIRPHDRTVCKLTEVNYTVLRIPDFAKENEPFLMQVFDNPWGLLAKVRDNNTWKNADAKIKITLPKGMVWDRSESKTATAQDVIAYSNEKEIVLADNHDINRHYSFSTDMIKGKYRTKLSDTELMHALDIKQKPFSRGEGSYDYNGPGIKAEILDKSLINFKTGKLKAPIKFEYYLNGKLVQTIEQDNFETLFVTSGSSGQGDGLTKTETVIDKATTTYRPGANLAVNKQRIISKAVNGEKEVTYTGKINDGGAITYTTTEKIKVKRQDGVIEVGNKTAKAIQTPYKFVYVYDETLQPGEFKVITKGQKGQIITTTTYDVNASDGSLSNPKSSEKVIEAKNEIIHFGAGAKIPGVTIKVGDDTTKQSEEVAIPAKMFYEADPTLPYGTKKVVKNAIDGKKVYIGEFKVSADGTPTFKILEEKIIKPKQDGLTKVGNKKVETTEIPPLPGGSKPGTKTTTTIYDIDPNTGEESNPKVTTKISYPAEKIQDIAKTTKVTKEDIPFNTIYTKDDKLKYNEKKVIQKGVKGENKVTTITQTGKKPIVNKELVKKPIDEIITIGNVKIVVEDVPPIKGGSKPGKKTTITTWGVDPKTGKLINPKETVKIVYPAEKIQDTAKTITHEEIPYKTVYVAKADLKAGEKEVFQKGVKGKKEITKIGSNKPTEKVIEKPTTEIIGIGNRKIDIEEVPPIKGGTKPGTKTTTTVWDADPKTGKLINPKVTTRISYPAEKIGDIATTVKVTKEEVPFNTIYKADENLTYNTKKVIQKGVKGENKVTTTKKPGTPDKVNKELVKKTIDEIISIGNKKVTKEEVPPVKGGTKPGTKTTTTVWDVDPKTGKLIKPKTTIKISYPMEDIQDIATKTTKDIADVDFEIIYEADPNLEYGKTQIKQDGKKGKKEITAISKVVDGKRVEEKSEKIIEEVVNKIISVGNKKVAKEDIDYKVIEKETDELEIGKSKIEKPGEKGIKEIITTSEVDPKTGKLINEKTEEVITKEPIDEIKLIGTKKVIPWTKIQDIAKPKEQPKENGNGKAKEEPKAQPVRQAMVPIAQPNVQTGIESANPAIVAALLSSVGLAITNKKKKED